MLLTTKHLDSDEIMRLLARTEERLEAPASLRPCQMYLDHGSSQPCMTEGHHLKPVYLQNRAYGKILDGTLWWLCSTCHDNLHAWLYFLLGERREPSPHPPLRAKAAAVVAYDWYTAAMEEKNSG